MKLGKTVLVEIVALFLQGLAKNEDISVKLRQLDLVATGPQGDPVLELSDDYIKQHPREGDWDKN